jgi:two-component system alkaline phosphatase synthesis response regulator PhoP
MLILVAEDDEVTREAIRDLLTAEGHQVLEAADGTAAIAAWRTARPELVLLDIMMPGASGYDVCRTIRREDSGVPLAFLSAKSEEVDIVLGLELGADDLIRKPFGKHELLARVRALVRRKAPPATEPESFAIGPWRILPRHQRAERGGHLPVDLTAREVSILHLLAIHPGEVITRDELLNRCWGMEYFPESRTLDQHILNLRKKLEEDPSDPRWIATVRGTGYRYPGGY